MGVCKEDGMSNASGKNIRILIVEDDGPSRLYLEVVLENLGYAFDVALNGQEAVDKVRQSHFDVVFMDVRMPVFNGYEATQEIRKTHKALPIIALTAHAIDGVKEKCLTSGMNDYLTKPFEKEQLLQMLLKWSGD